MRLKNALFYVITLGVFMAGLWWILSAGTSLELGRDIQESVQADTSSWTQFVESLKVNIHHPLAMLLIQIVTIIFVARAFGWVCKKIGQPSVIGEIIAGIALGPSLLGAYLPEVSSWLFPAASLGNLQFLSQIGLILFMFVIGMELDLQVLRNRAQDAVIVSHASIIIPFTLGVGLAYFMYERFAPRGVEFIAFGLFMGIAMSITAFPVLARIVQERGLHKTKLGAVVITCAAADDITAWCILAAVIAIVKAGSFVSALYIILLAAIYMVVMVYGVRPFLRRVGDLHPSNENLSKPVVAIFFLSLILSAFASEIIGIHALFGAFMAGVIMPTNTKFRSVFIEKVEDVAIVLLLPLFFVFTGLRTEIGLLASVELWKLCGVIILVAVMGKFVGSAAAARFVGQSWRDSLSIGALMNTRGLMELVVLNIGYDLGVLKAEVFAMMVVMALATTFMTGPALDSINWFFKKKDARKQAPQDSKLFQVLISFGNPLSGPSLLRLARAFLGKEPERASITALHLSASSELHQYDMEVYEEESFAPITVEGAQAGQAFTQLYKASSDIDSDITETANQGNFDMLLIGLGQSIFEGSLLGKLLGFTSGIINPDRLYSMVTGRERLFENSPFDERTKQILYRSKPPVGILIDKDLPTIQRVLLPLYHNMDAFLLQFARRLADSGIAIEIINVSGKGDWDDKIEKALQQLSNDHPNSVKISPERAVSAAQLSNQDLVLISLESWKRLVEAQSAWLNLAPSTLIMRA